MTISSQVKQTLASLKSIEASLSMFSDLSQDQNSKNIYLENAEKAHRLVEKLRHRMQEIEMEEPQYKGL